MLAHELFDAEMDAVMAGGNDEALKGRRRRLRAQGFGSMERCR
jgi:hypothetical protein